MASTVLARMAVQISANSAELVRATQQGSRSLLSLSKTAESAGRLIGAYFGVTTIFRGVSYAVGVLAGFEQKMQEVRAVTGATGEQFLALQRNATALGASTEYTATQVAGLQAEFGRLGFSTKEILNSTTATLNLATATRSDLARSAEIAGSTLRAFQLDAKEMGRVTDVMTSSFNKSALQLDNFAESIKYVAPIAAAANVSLEETTAYLGALADAGIKGSQAGTGMRRIFAELAKDGRPVAERMQELANKGLTLTDAFDEVGRYAQTALLVLSSNNEKVKDLTKTFQGAQGEAKRTADIMRDTLAGDFKLLTSAIDGAIQKGTLFSALLRTLTQGATSFIQSVSPDEFRQAFNALLAGQTGAKDVLEKIVIGGGKIDLSWQELLEGGFVRVESAAKKYEAILAQIQARGEAIAKQNSLEEDAIKHRDKILGEAALKRAREEQAARDAQEELNKKYRERLELIQQSVRATEIQAKYEAEIAKSITDVVVPGSQKPNVNLPDQITPGKESPFGEFKIIPDGLIEETEERLARMEEITNHIENLNSRISKSFADLGVAVLEAAGSAIGGGENFGQSLLRILANFGKQYGTQLIALGVAKIAEGTAFDNPNAIRKGYGLIAAGGALVLASSALYSAVSSSGRFSGSSGGSNNFNNSYRGPAVSDFGNAFTFKISGKDLVTVMEQTQSDNKIRKG